MKKTVIFAGFLGIILMGTACAEDLKVATDGFVDTSITIENRKVIELNNTADRDKVTVDANHDAAQDIEAERQVIPTNQCGDLGSDYSGCGYIAAGGPTENQGPSDYQWIKIRNGNNVTD